VAVAIPVTAFAHGTWQLQRLARLEDRVVKPHLLLSPKVDPTAIDDFDYRRVLATGRFRPYHEMLVGPRIRDGENGFRWREDISQPRLDLEDEGS
jgi:surfeit locus 1 family protein